MNNKKIFSFSNHDLFSIGLVLLLAFSKLIPHPPNFTPIITVAIMSGYFFKNLKFSLSVLLVSMLASDMFIGFYKNMIFTYFSLFLITYIFFKINKKINYKNLFVFGFFGSLMFYLISNFGVWVLGNLYEKNLNGLITCYYMAIPFFKNTVLSTFFYSYLGLFAFTLKNRFKLNFKIE